MKKCATWDCERSCGANNPCKKEVHLIVFNVRSKT